MDYKAFSDGLKKDDLLLLEHMHRRAAKLVKRLENKIYEERTGIVYRGKEEAEGRPHRSLQLPERRLYQGGCQSLFSGEGI